MTSFSRSIVAATLDEREHLARPQHQFMGWGGDLIEQATASRGAAVPRRGLAAPQLAALSFLGLIAVGTAGFLVLPGLYTGEPIGWVDALFMATSAVCVTGLGREGRRNSATRPCWSKGIGGLRWLHETSFVVQRVRNPPGQG
jgi:hypothetical protein